MNAKEITEFLNGLEKSYGIPACECIVYQNHKQIYRHFVGHRDAKKTMPLQGGEWYWLYSGTKVATVTAAMQLVERGLICLDDEVSKYLPAFADMFVREKEGGIRKATTKLTVRHLMTMTGGFTYDLSLPSLLKAKEESNNQASTQEMINALAKEPLIFDPGTHFQYGMGHDILAAVIEVASGESFAEYIDNHVAKPLGITGLTLFPTEKEFDNMPDKFVYAGEGTKLRLDSKQNATVLTEKYESGGAGICCRAEDYILLLDALACGGVGANGARILSDASIALLRTNQLNEIQLKDYHQTMKPDPCDGYGLGVRVRITDDGEIPKGEFGWDGMAGANAVVYPEKNISIMYVQHVMDYLAVWRKLLPDLCRLIYKSI